MHSQLVFHKPFDGNNEVHSLIEANNQLYAAVGRHNPPHLKIFELSNPGCRVWLDVTPDWAPSPSTGKMPGTYSIALASFQNDLYIGTDGGWVHRLARNITPKIAPVQLSGAIDSFANFKGELYAFGGYLHRTANGVQWQNLGKLPSKPNRGVAPPTTLAVFDGHLYAGRGFIETTSAGQKTKQGIEIYRSPNGTDWKYFHSLEEDLAGVGVGGGGMPQHVHAMTVFDGHLYIGAYEGYGGVVFRTNGTVGHWEQANAMPSGLVVALEEHDGNLFTGRYIGVGNLAGEKLLYATPEGTKWSIAPGSPIGTPTSNGIRCLKSFEGRLYVGTRDVNAGGQVIEWCDAPSACTMATLSRSAKHLFRAIELWRKDLMELFEASGCASEPTEAEGAVADISKALARLCVAAAEKAVQVRLQRYLDVVRAELAAAATFAAAAMLNRDPALRDLDRAQLHCDRALKACEAFLLTFEDLRSSSADAC